MAVNIDKDAVEEDVEGMLVPPQDGHIPFDGHAQVLEVTGDVHQRQLIEEVYAHLGDRNAYQVVLTGDDSGRALYILGDTDMDAVQDVVTAHTPDPYYGMSDTDRKVSELRERLGNGEDLSPADLNTLLRAML
jgi:hypothetical protein